ncbi:hypothetical protein P8452_75151 [Trifolium repens]|nr:hypothetical protein P8452_75151 [Trifolium repens]
MNNCCGALSTKRCLGHCFAPAASLQLTKTRSVVIGQNSIVSPLSRSCLLLCCMPPQLFHLVDSAYNSTKTAISGSCI